MPIHDWTRVSAGTWLDFHLGWVAEIRNVLNGGLLPSEYYAQAEQIVGPFGPDVLTLQSHDVSDGPNGTSGGTSGAGGVAVASKPPRAKLVASAEMSDYAQKRRVIVIRHSSGDRVIALLEIVSPGNKESRHAIRSFIDKAVSAIAQGLHLLVIDLFPPGPRDPQGIHGAIWNELTDQPYELPASSPLTLAAYAAGPIKQAYVENSSVGKELLEMPLFLEPDLYVDVPLEATYMAAYRGVPQRWKRVLE